MLQGFKDFIMRGNVIDLAVAVVIGGAFTAIVTAFTDNLINPAIAALGSADVSGLGFQITSNPATFMDFGKVITAALNFLIIAAVVYFVLVLPMNKLKELQDARKKVETEEDVPVPIEVELLSEIRDLLKEGNPSAGATKNPF
ncbi:large conductance mechanosensitive channel protein MscL [Corynebacterium canis]|uniref:Large-conductance mechanosensitive channel n=1 Tax=Corynebacterium canis TaxID=679663 RepID=A0A5C5ULV1_9CORY|nr:large conductance mechanosensitive channel protein MscL [Corynebacterium canis]TWT26662.1 large conductance mechanosensitive channel protein MscL [Corynebacterium canis]WJY74661.1 Large-conductance mechanosensitive channel [Corynebacterium canis]